MSKIKHTTAMFVARVASTLVLSLGVAMMGSLSASAHGTAGRVVTGDAHVTGSFRQANPRYFGYAGSDAEVRTIVPDRSAAGDACYLPSDGCENYLSN